MEDLNELKKAILEMEKAAKNFEIISEHLMLHERVDKGFSAAEYSEIFRIAAACMWEKLEQLEKEAHDNV